LFKTILSDIEAELAGYDGSIISFFTSKLVEGFLQAFNDDKTKTGLTDLITLSTLASFNGIKAGIG
jgi:hypothetical protein